MLFFYLLFPNMFTAILAIRDTLKLHQSILEMHNEGIRLLDEKTAVLWGACMKKTAEEEKTNYIS
jgi:hypothetical protein